MNPKFFSLVLLSALTFSCISDPIFIPENQKKFKPNQNTITYPAYAKECGFVLLFFIPIGINGRFAKAYSKISAQAKDGILSQITLEESWYYGFFGTGYCTTITALVTRESSP
ncbi:hypothetical protein [Leptospira barantonii]|uniref:hypothetical protein n=1 Tax=Leptospira barantonii TaxID=2023184 RepID=UPI0014383A3F|nr:hypothetical protein [Leptospira barantonii]